MRTYVLRRLAVFPLFLLIVSIVTFLIIRGLPGDAALVNLGLGNAGCQECADAVRRDLGLDKPLIEQYRIWITNAFQGDFGNSTTNKRPIAPELRNRAWNTFQITVVAMVFTVAIGVPLGAISAIKRGTAVDYLARFTAIAGLSVPNFWIGTLVVLLPAIWWGWTPARQWVGWGDPIEHVQLLALPAAVLAISSAAYVARIVRSSMVEAMYSDYVRTARSKGLRERRVIAAHVFRNSMLTLLTVLGLQAGVLVGSAVIIEAIFSVPGLGSMAAQAVLARDYQTLQAVIVVFAAWFITVQLVVDLSYAWVDPRIRY